MANADERLPSQPGEDIGFIGLGVMGQPMALNLARAGVRLVVWNRSPERTEPLRSAGAEVASSVDDVFGRARIVILMLINEAALDAVLGRGTPDFSRLVSNHIVVSMGSNSPDYSRNLANDIINAGGRYVEAPVSGSKKPAEAGQLVSLLGGSPDSISEIRPFLVPMCREIIICGPVGNGLLMKLAINLFLYTTMAGLAEAVHFADRHALDLNRFKMAIDSGPLNSNYSQMKISKLISRDFSVHATTDEAFRMTMLIMESARAAELSLPMLQISSDLIGESIGLGNGHLDMASVLEAIEARTEAIGNASA